MGKLKTYLGLDPNNPIMPFNDSLHQHTLEQVQSAKYLGLAITDNLELGQHVSKISCKATKTSGFLRGSLALAPPHSKEVAYKTLVCRQLQYASPIWHPYNDTETKRVEKVQKTSKPFRFSITAARWTCGQWQNRSSVDDMLDKLAWPSLEDRRVESSLFFCILGLYYLEF